MVRDQPPIFWIQLDGKSVLYACEAVKGSIALRRFSGSGDPVDVATLPEQAIHAFAVGADAYWFGEGDRVMRLPKSGGDPKEHARVPGKVELIAVDSDNLYVATRPALTATETGGRGAVAGKGTPLTTVPTAVVSSGGGGLYRIPTSSRNGKPIAIATKGKPIAVAAKIKPIKVATLEVAQDLRVTSDAVYWLDGLSHTLHRLPKSAASAVSTQPIGGSVMSYMVDDRGLVAVRGNSMKAKLVGLPASGAPIEYAAGKLLVVYAMDGKRVVYRQGLGPLLQVPRNGGEATAIRAPDVTFSGFALDGRHAYAGVAGRISGVPTRGIIRITL